MILDSLLMFDNPSAAITATAASGNVVDLLNARDLGLLDDIDIDVLCDVNTAFTTTNAGTLTVQFQGSTDNSTYTTYAESRAYAASALTAGARLLQVSLPGRSLGAAGIGGDALPRYYRMNYTVANAFTAGKVTSGLVLDRQDQSYYPPGITIAN